MDVAPELLQTKRKLWSLLNSGDEELHGNSADPQLLPKRREKGVDDGTGTANRRFAVAAADWESVGGARTPNPE